MALVDQTPIGASDAVVPQNTSDPSSVSSDYASMKDSFDMIFDILGGRDRIQKQSTKYLPQYEKESKNEYGRRLAVAPWRPEFEDALRSLTAKPFQREVQLTGSPSQSMQDFAEDVDGRGNDLTRFAREVFTNAVGYGVHGILVDYPTMTPGLSLGAERDSGARPYFVHVNAENLIALYTDYINGKQVITHVRIRERFVERYGFTERIVNRVRIFEPGRFEIWETVPQQSGLGSNQPSNVNTNQQTAMVKIQEGVVTIPEVPLALFFTNKRTSEYFVKPPLIDLAQMQIELYRALSRQEEILTYAGSPILVAQGMSPPEESKDGTETKSQITVGPRSVLFAPPTLNTAQPDWKYIEPSAANITAIGGHIQSLINDMNRLGLQPAIDRRGTITATASAYDAAKAHSTLQAWAIGLRDVLEQSFIFVNQWMGSKESVAVDVYTDFSGDAGARVDEAKVLQLSRVAGDLSRETYWQELSRRGILGPDFILEDEEQKIAEDQQGLLVPEVQIDPRNGEIIPQPGIGRPQQQFQLDPVTGLPAVPGTMN